MQLEEGGGEGGGEGRKKNGVGETGKRQPPILLFFLMLFIPVSQLSIFCLE